MKCAATALLNGVLIGWELSMVLGVPFWFNLVSITASQIIVFMIGVVALKRLFVLRVM